MMRDEMQGVVRGAAVRVIGLAWLAAIGLLAYAMCHFVVKFW